MIETKKIGWLTVLAGILLGIGITFFEAFVCMQLFNWFIAPIFNYRIGYWVAYGICIIIAFIHLGLNNSLQKIKDNTPGVTVDFGYQLTEIISLLILWGIGALVSLGV